jgi:hypothetical protein
MSLHMVTNRECRVYKSHILQNFLVYCSFECQTVGHLAPRFPYIDEFLLLDAHSEDVSANKTNH